MWVLGGSYLLPYIPAHYNIMFYPTFKKNILHPKNFKHREITIIREQQSIK